jgi:hypothetical protein
MGLVENYFFSASGSPANLQWDDVLIYYQKNSVDCGTPDATTLSVTENFFDGRLTISPNPASGNFTINSELFEPAIMKIYNGSGRLLDSIILSNNKTIYNCSSFDPGLYFVWVSGMSNTCLRKLLLK